LIYTRAEEVAELIQSSVSAVKSALHRGREQLQQTLELEQVTEVVLSVEQQTKLHYYALHFNNRQFDQLRNLLADEVRLDMVGKGKFNTKLQVGNYFGNYNKQNDWYMAPGIVEGKPAILAFEDKNACQPNYFILLEYDHSNITFIRDFRYARYIMEQARWNII